jgi:hypothetical protein
MNILMLGCSYGVPNYFGPPGVPSKHHLEFLLRSQGHCVHNCSKNGASNLETLSRASQYLLGHRIEHPAYTGQYIECKNIGPLSLVIWFHTEVSRDSTIDFNFVYQEFANFFLDLAVPVAVIGGAGDVLPEFETFFTPNFFIPSWRRLILDQHLPLTNHISQSHMIEKSNLSVAQKIQIINDSLHVLQYMQNSPHFPDGCHPGTWPHQDLFDRLVKANLI